MNIGVISRRYATALLKYVTESGHGEQVYAQVKALLADPDTAPKPLCEDLQKFTALLVKNDRMPMVKLVFSSFLQQYEAQAGIHVARLKTAVDSPALQEKLQAFVREKIGGTVEFKTEVDPDLIGGFVLDVDGCRMDASVARQLDDIRKQWIEKNKRIV
ncbi:MAG: F0F1 ATP synthase subunit delta [Bacteroidales bacterium]|nr:F0F1 ATP synthase subunit delta [Bacteroidales bacterium]